MFQLTVRKNVRASRAPHAAASRARRPRSVQMPTASSASAMEAGEETRVQVQTKGSSCLNMGRDRLDVDASIGQ